MKWFNFKNNERDLLEKYDEVLNKYDDLMDDYCNLKDENQMLKEVIARYSIEVSRGGITNKN